MNSLYTDGGVVGKNPSVLGGTWAWVVVKDNMQVLERGSGFVSPSDLGVDAVTNNHMELYTLLRALRYICKHYYAEWIDEIWSDSKVSIGRLTLGWSLNNVPAAMIKELDFIQSCFNFSIGGIKVGLVDGHPTDEQLKMGIGKRGYRASRWNVVCDQICNEEKAAVYGQRNALVR